MVFTKLGQHEKDAFFSLLDEYFASRPEIFANSQSSETEASTAAASAVRRAVVSNPETTAKIVSSGLRHFAGANPSSTANRSSAASASHHSSSSSAANAGAGEPSEHETTSVAARVAAAQAMFSGKHNPFGKFGSANPSTTTTAPPSSTPPSVRANAPATAMLKQDTGLAPPPVRRAPSARQQPPTPKEEWVEALYDYNSGEAGDLKIEEGQRVLLVERTSDDWWTGEVNGQKGLFPASYVRAI